MVTRRNEKWEARGDVDRWLRRGSNEDDKRLLR